MAAQSVKAKHLARADRSIPPAKEEVVEGSPGATSVEEVEALLAECSSLDSLADFIERMVDEWAERENIVYSIACAGEAFARGAVEGCEVTVESTVFKSIQHFSEDTYYSNRLRAAAKRLAELASLGQRKTS